MSEKYMDIAKEFLNLNESSLKLQQFLTVNPKKLAWCADFTNQVLKRAGKAGTGSLAARSFLKWGEATSNPKKGDIVVFWRVRRNSWQGHVAFYHHTEGKKVYVVGGNQGDKVSYRWYHVDRVLGYRRG